MTTCHGLSKAKACRIVGLSRTALYRPKVNWLERDKVVIDAVNTTLAKRPRWGFWKIFYRMRLDGWAVPGFKDTLLRCFLELEVLDGTAQEFFEGVQA